MTGPRTGRAHVEYSQTEVHLDVWVIVVDGLDVDAGGVICCALLELSVGGGELRQERL